MNQQIVATLLVGLSLGLPSYAAAGVTASPHETATSREAWVQRIADAQQTVDAAHTRYAQAIRSYGQMRHRRRARGERKADVLIEQEAARGDVSRATRQLEETLEAARRAGIPPGWVREGLAQNSAAAKQAH